MCVSLFLDIKGLLKKHYFYYGPQFKKEANQPQLTRITALKARAKSCLSLCLPRMPCRSWGPHQSQRVQGLVRGTVAGFRVSHREVLGWKWSGAAQMGILAEFAGFVHPSLSTYFMAHSRSISSVMKYVKCKASQLLLFLTLCRQKL